MKFFFMESNTLIVYDFHIYLDNNLINNNLLIIKKILIMNNFFL
jgi:hypothetical protein